MGPRPGSGGVRRRPRELGDFPVVAENLGAHHPPVERLRHELDMPGTFVLQFAFSDDLREPAA